MSQIEILEKFGLVLLGVFTLVFLVGWANKDTKPSDKP